MMWWLLALPRTAVFMLWFAGQMIRANWQVAADVLTPGSSLTPAVIRYQTRCRTNAELTVLSDLITLTPGTLSIDVAFPGEADEVDDVDMSDGDPVVYVLGLYAPPEREDFRARLADMESRMLRVMRRPTSSADAGVEREGRRL